MDLLTNDKIYFKQVQVIKEDGTSLGIMKIKDALYTASLTGLDLVCVAPKSSVPVCKIMDYGKYKYDTQKKEKLAKRNQHNTETSEIQISYMIQDHDLQVKANTAKRLIERGDDVRIVLRLKGREVSYTEAAKKKVEHLIELCSDFTNIKKDIFVEGRDIKAIIERKK